MTVDGRHRWTWRLAIVVGWLALILGVFWLSHARADTKVPRGTFVPALHWSSFALPAAVPPPSAGARFLDLPPDDGIWLPVTAEAPAVRLDPPPPTGLNGLPFAPPGLSSCDEAQWYRLQAGLPARFDALAYRESRCLNRDDVRTGCCVGWWQLDVATHLRDSRMRPLYAACDITSYTDVNSDTPLDKQRQACGAAALYSVVGLTPWRLT